MLSVISIISNGLKLINALVRYAHDQGLIDQGKQLQISTQLQEIATSAGIAREIERETDAMTNEQIARDLEGDFRE